MPSRWSPGGGLTEVWDRWTVETTDFNPAFPGLFPGAVRVDVDALAVEITGRPWPAEYLEP